MSQFRTFTTGVQTVRSFEGKDTRGNTVVVSEWTRPVASTVGITYVSIWSNGVGTFTEQFSGWRNDFVGSLYDSTVAAITPRAEKQKPGLVKGAKEAAPVELFNENGVQVFVVRGATPVYRLYQNNVQIGDDIRAGKDWQAVKKSTLAEAKRLATAE